MKKTLLLLLSVTLLVSANAQLGKLFKKKKPTPASYVKEKPAPVVKKDWSKIDLSKRPADHIMIQYGSDVWLGRPDSARTTGFSRSFNIYAMMDKPFKSNPYFSIAYGIGIGSSNIFFDKVNVQVAANSPSLPFSDVSNSNHFNKFKVTTMYVEIPIEIRHYSNPENPNKSWKMAAGVKLGTLLKAYTKGKDLQDKSGNSIYGASYIEKHDNSKFFNSLIATASARIGYGAFSLHGDFQITSVVKPGLGPDIHTLSIGLTISGL